MPDLDKAFLSKLYEAPAFCFTSDIEWASERMIEDMLNIFSESEVPLTVFLTHRSEAIHQNYKGDLAKHVGLHPNFLLGSSQGDNHKEIIGNLIDIWPESRCFRSHAYVDSSLITQEFYDRGFRYDSNICLHLQSRLFPLQGATGLLRFPVFLEDDCYAIRERVWNLTHISDLLSKPGLKIFNFHPAYVALNIPDVKYYQNVKCNINDDYKNLVYTGKGARTFLLELLTYVKNNPGLGTFYLDDLYSLSTDLSHSTVPKPQTSIVEAYEKAGLPERADMVRTNYETRNGKQIYATSRDFNLRELEIDFVIDSIKGYIKSSSSITKILDIGCGNGYTDIRIAQEVKAEIVGIDFSEEMISGAKYLSEKFSDRVLNTPNFYIGDVRKLSWDDAYFDIVISERCLLNLPDRDIQYDVIREVHRVLREGGTYIMVEGTLDGLRRLNKLRMRLGLESIPDRAEDNLSSLKFVEKEIEKFVSEYFKVVKKQHFGMYYLISRVAHPLLVYPDAPKFDAKINEVARKIATHDPDYKKMGHVMGLVLTKV